MGQRHCRLQPGDLIEIKRGCHQHWALYLGDGYVINVRPRETWGLRDHNARVYIRDIQKQLLKEVVKKGEWRVNNDSDRDHTPLPAEEIIRRAEWWIDKVVLYGVFGRKCERFVKKLRYGDQPKTRERGEMHNADMAHDTSYPNPGDLIEIKRQGYQHWALYVGDGYVIHVTAADEKALAVSTCTVTILTRRATVKKELLKDVAKGDKWYVSNKHDWYRVPYPAEEIIRRAESWIGKDVSYRLLLRNCEHFVTTLRYGEGVSDQAGKALEIFHGIAIAAGMGLICVPSLGSNFFVVAPFMAALNVLAKYHRECFTLNQMRIDPKDKAKHKEVLDLLCC